MCIHEECGKTFRSRTMRNDHFRKVHVKAECPECHKLFSVNFLNKHITYAHQESKKRFWCEMCGKGYLEKFKFEEHKAIEHKGQRYKCRYPECTSDQEYRDQSNRLAHERKKHGATYTKFLARTKV